MQDLRKLTMRVDCRTIRAFVAGRNGQGMRDSLARNMAPPQRVVRRRSRPASLPVGARGKHAQQTRESASRCLGPRPYCVSARGVPRARASERPARPSRLPCSARSSPSASPSRAGPHRKVANRICGVPPSLPWLRPLVYSRQRLFPGRFFASALAREALPPQSRRRGSVS
jgi:hypothetical protein